MTAGTADPETIRDVVLNSHGNFDRVRELIEADPSLVNVNAPWEETPVQAATHMGNARITEWLIDRGAPVDIFTAAMLGRTDDVARMLDENPALVDTPGVHGMPIMYFPAASGRVDVLELLLDRGANVNAGAGGNTALHAAAMFGRVDAARWLLAHGADRSATDYEGKTPRERACGDLQAEL